MTVEVKNLESDFQYVKEECIDEKIKAGEDLKIFGRRFVELIDEYIPSKVTSIEWANLQNSLKYLDIPKKDCGQSSTLVETVIVNATGKPNGSHS